MPCPHWIGVLLGSWSPHERVIDSDKNGENVVKLEVHEKHHNMWFLRCVMLKYGLRRNMCYDPLSKENGALSSGSGKFKDRSQVLYIVC